MKAVLKLAVIFALAVIPAWAADPLSPADVGVPRTVYVATLINGFSIHFDHRREMQGTSRLFISPSEIYVSAGPHNKLNNVGVPVPRNQME